MKDDFDHNLPDDEAPAKVERRRCMADMIEQLDRPGGFDKLLTEQDLQDLIGWAYGDDVVEPEKEELWPDIPGGNFKQMMVETERRQRIFDRMTAPDHPVSLDDMRFPRDTTEEHDMSERRNQSAPKKLDHRDPNALYEVEDAARMDSFGHGYNAVSRDNRTMAQRGVDSRINEAPNPLYDDLDEVEVEGAEYVYKSGAGQNLDEIARATMDRGKAGVQAEENRRRSAKMDDLRRRMIPDPVTGEGCVRGGPMQQNWPGATIMPHETMDKLKDTIEKMGQGGDGGGFRMNAGKNQIELLPEIWIWALANVMTKGVEKGYPSRNWEEGMDWSSMIGCMYRHLAKFQSGQRYDGKELNKKLGTTGCHELAMIAWNALALMFYDIYGVGNNDLPVYEDLDHFIRVNGSSSDLAVRWAKEEVNDV